MSNAKQKPEMTVEEFAEKWAIYYLGNEIAARDAMLSDLRSVIRGKLVEYDNYLTRNKWGLREIATPEQSVDEFLNENWIE